MLVLQWRGGQGLGFKPLHLHMAVGEQVLHHGAVRALHAGVVDCEAEGQQLLQRGVLRRVRLLLQDDLGRRGVLRTQGGGVLEGVPLKELLCRASR